MVQDNDNFNRQFYLKNVNTCIIDGKRKSHHIVEIPFMSVFLLFCEFSIVLWYSITSALIFVMLCFQVLRGHMQSVISVRFIETRGQLISLSKDKVSYHSFYLLDVVVLLSYLLNLQVLYSSQEISTLWNSLLLNFILKFFSS